MSSQVPAEQPLGLLRDIDPPLPSMDILSGYGAKILDPLQAVTLPGQAVRNTAYVADRLLIPASVPDATWGLLQRAAAEQGYRLELDEADADRPLGVRRTRIVPAGDRPTVPPDAWTILQWARSLAAPDELTGVGLDHLLFASVGVIGVPYHSSRQPQQAAATPQPEAQPPAAPGDAASPPPAPAPTPPARDDAAFASYVRQGSGGRQPVIWSGPAPHRRSDDSLPGRRPVVAILDNGCGRHPWLDYTVRANLSLDGRPIGLTLAGFDPEISGDLIGPLDDYSDAVAGHGTFMAGLVRIACPDADILAIRVVNPDGVVVESDLIAALGDLAELVRRNSEGEPGGRPIDVLVLSMGYYHETPDAAADPALAWVLDELGRLGVIVVAAAGNDATTRPMYPAAFAPWATGDRTAYPDRVPLVSVGALNPDATDAWFSNGGPWVSAWAAGASVVSTMPDTFHGGLTPVSTSDNFGRRRSTIDPDDYRCGFAVWSGTSFAAPTVAGRLADELLRGDDGGLQADDVPAAVERARRVLDQCLGLAG
ncbi:S8 family peptidase [Nocardioides speluncae]|uniref:S8 family peptidase n=1 Tax=Nocardioides speluncae TaxID=2670337 RepID=UPI000D69BC98|nr:S8/S53 family peptidase [Nocardioides speluncae]